MQIAAVDVTVGEIRRDAQAERLALWGQSTLIDEFTGVASIDQPLFDTLHAAAGIDATFPVGNAGVLHIYGYWYSEVVTPFGYKRDRWADGALAEALGLEATAFHLAPESGTTLLERVTAAVLPHLMSPPADAITADIKVGEYRTRVVALAPSAAGVSALIYGIAPAGSTHWRLVTTFPVAGDAAAMIAECVAEPRLRFNATAP